MSYDLFFKATTRQPDRHDFEEYFESRANYEINDTQAWYENESTGVYFSFELSDSSEDDFDDPQSPMSGSIADDAADDRDREDEDCKLDTSADDAADDYWVAFNMNYFRPHTFALEAATEIKAFVDYFQLAVIDPQNDEAHPSPFKETQFTNGWNAGNLAAYQDMLRADDKRKPFVLATAALEQNWRWNFTVAERQEHLAEDIFVPTIMYIKHRGEIKSVVCWPDAIPILIPHVDMFVIGRNTLAIPPLSEEESGETALVDWSALLPHLDSFPHILSPIPHYKLSYEKAPCTLIHFVQSLSILADEVEGVGKDEVLNAELIEQARK